MKALTKLQKMCGDSKPYKVFTFLAKGYHKIESFRLVDNKFATKDDSDNEKKTVLVELKNEVLFSKYFSKNFNEKDIKDINSDGETKYLYFGGQGETSKLVYPSFIFFTYKYCFSRIEVLLVKR